MKALVVIFTSINFLSLPRTFRDLKMENILLDKRKRQVKIVGKFGIAYHIEEPEILWQSKF